MLPSPWTPKLLRQGYCWSGDLELSWVAYDTVRIQGYLSLPSYNPLIYRSTSRAFIERARVELELLVMQQLQRRISTMKHARPTRHMVANMKRVINPMRPDWKRYCSPYFTVEAYKKVYEGAIKPILHESDWDKITDVILPPIKSRKPGRPAIQRKRGLDEGPVRYGGKKQVRCSICKEYGHNKTTCTGGCADYEAYVAATSKGPAKKGATKKGGRPRTRPRKVDYGVPVENIADDPAFSEFIAQFEPVVSNRAGKGKAKKTYKGKGKRREPSQHTFDPSQQPFDSSFYGYEPSQQPFDPSPQPSTPMQYPAQVRTQMSGIQFRNPMPTMPGIQFRNPMPTMPDHNINSSSSLESALNQTGIKPVPALLLTIFNHFDSSPKPLFSLFQWAMKQPSYCSNAPVLNLMIDLLGKCREFDSAWLLLLDHFKKNDDNGVHSIVSGDTLAILIRRYARAGMPFPAIRVFEFAENLGTNCVNVSNSDLFEILLDSLCKEGHVRIASGYVVRRKENVNSKWIPSVRVYNIVLNGWFRLRKLKHAERLWDDMRKENVVPTVVTYGTLVEGYCRMRRVERAMELVSEMRKEGIQPNAVVFNPIVDALAESGRFKEALGMLERFSILESGPTVSTYNSLVKGFCKAKDLVGASKVLKMMIGRGFTPTSTTYNYFFRYFAKFGKIEEGMNLYTKIIQSGYVPDRLTYHLLIKMLCEHERLELVVQVTKEMRARGFDLDLATSTMLVHLLCKLHRFEEACMEFEDMIRRGITPQYLTYKKLTDNLKKSGMAVMAQKLSVQMSSLPHSTNLPDTYREGGDRSRELRSSIIKKAQAMSDILKTSKDPRELSKMRNSSQNFVASANQLVEDIRRKFSRS
ncbi:Pentatricopeptide repeat-containing protein [Thalictrum thalictroides]|uniref:Pentatricopeptide repeat-containing protein n=1 Tax=Thalictrum thalictroides TaxID=46969 RepID=A0A7J6WIE0_THATH|nr:Pentatricopeptide repeat-containing protein [Thalictrum thalictroides]